MTSSSSAMSAAPAVRSCTGGPRRAAFFILACFFSYPPLHGEADFYFTSRRAGSQVGVRHE